MPVCFRPLYIYYYYFASQITLPEGNKGREREVLRLMTWIFTVTFATTLPQPIQVHHWVGCDALSLISFAGHRESHYGPIHDELSDRRRAMARPLVAFDSGVELEASGWSVTVHCLS